MQFVRIGKDRKMFGTRIAETQAEDKLEGVFTEAMGPFRIELMTVF